MKSTFILYWDDNKFIIGNSLFFMDLEDFYLLKIGGTNNLSQAYIVLSWMLRLYLVTIFIFYFQSFFFREYNEKTIFFYLEIKNMFS